ARRECTVSISVRRSDAHHRSRHRPQQGAGDGADAPGRGLLAHLFAKRGRDLRAAHSRRHHQQRPGQRIRHGPTLSRLRGFAASPLQGTPQGLAVYMQGIRVNEAFGDTVNWDLIPKVAIGRSDIWTNNPAFGLNALGGAISFQMKDGFTYNGTEFDASGGSYGRVGGSLQYGVRNGEWGLYLAAEGLKDDGWRLQSPSRLARF